MNQAQKIVTAILNEEGPVVPPSRSVCLIKERDTGNVVHAVDSTGLGILGVEDALQEAGFDDEYEVEEVTVLELGAALHELGIARGITSDDDDDEG